MRERSAKAASFSVDVLLVTAMGNELAILFARSSAERERWSIPWKVPQTGEAVDTAAGRVAQEAIGELPIWLEQVGAFGDGKRHPSDADISAAYVGLGAHRTASGRTGYAWFPVRDLPPL